MAIVTTDNANYKAIANAIRAKTGSAETYTPAQMAAAIQAMQTDGAPASVNDVNFIDYDGTFAASYTLAEIQTLTALPDGPAHDGLIFQGWNWTLADIQALNRPVDVGAMYITDDGKTRLYIRIAAEGRRTVPLYIGQSVSHGVTIDWGDGSAPETLAGADAVNTAHTYAGIGDYVITLDVADGCMLGFGGGASGYCVLGPTGNNSLAYCNMLQAVEIGRNVPVIQTYAFSYCRSLRSITVPDSVTSFGTYAFYSCYSLESIAIPYGASMNSTMFMACDALKCISIPASVKSIGNYLCNGCFAIASVTIPEGTTSINAYAFQNCPCLTDIIIPASVTSIGSNAFNYCYGMAAYHLRPDTPPTLGNTAALGGIPDDCIIYVPQGCLEAYQSATNWAPFADYMREEV